ncbi:16S rRNA (cytosine(1402)-N(4))-methyltransferase, partial [Candidatus Uhrbacteria bacterium]|nr:16S rRNA (cytosine(1402)-N(4))-methyltransferase [Candidatus Uhrbacteria bacterium]
EGEWEQVTKKPMVPSDQEQHVNPRSRSAKLRIAKKSAKGGSATG